jgi:Ca-activated chloride channel family protein
MKSAIAALAALLALPALVMADGFMRPVPPRPEVQVQAFAVKYHHVTVDIENQVARVEIDQIFHNPNDVALEGEYVFPIPEYAAIDKLALRIDGKEIQGELLDKDKARQYFQQAVRESKDPALLEYMGQRMFRLRVTGIAPKGDKRVQLAYSHVVPADNGLCGFGYPLNTEKFSSKPLETCRIVVRLKGDGALKNVYSPTHPIDVAKKNANEFQISYEEKNVKPDRDFLLYYADDKTDLGLNVLAYRKPGEDGYFMVFASPKHDTSAPPAPKDVVFVVDVSGSMRGDKIVQARGALRHCVESLNEADRFNVLTFSNGVTKLFEGLEEARRANVIRARDFAAALQANGGTNIHDALFSALDHFAGEAARPGYVVFLTDGMPTVGPVTDAPGIAKAVQAKNAGRVRIFNFGVGYDVNTVLLNQLALENKGVSEYVAPAEDIEVKVSSFYAKINFPALADPKLAIAGLEFDQVYPRPLPDIFMGGQAIVYGRYSGEGEKEVTLQGMVRGKPTAYAVRATFPAADARHEFVPRFWAMTKIGFLLDQIRIHGENAEVKEEIVRLSKEFGVMTPYTSWMVVDELAKNNRRAYDGLRERGAAAPPAAEAKRAQSGQAPTGDGAFKAGKAFSDMQKGEFDSKKAEEMQASSARGAVRNVADKTFFGGQTRWVDGAYHDKMETKKVAFDSEEYWKLIERHAALARYQSIGIGMIVVLDGVAYEISDK